MVFNKISYENIKTFSLKRNGEVIYINDEGVNIKENDIITLKIKKVSRIKPSTFYIEGYSPDVIYDRKAENTESELDYKNLPQEIEVE